MRKALSLILASVMFLSLCACSGRNEPHDKNKIQIDETTAPSFETMSVNMLFEDINNEAKCSLNIGKQVTVLGQIQNISSDSCKIKLVSHPDKSVHIRLPIEKLAELSQNSFIAVTGIVEAYKDQDWSWYTISATDLLDDNKTDAIFGEIVADKYNYSKFYSAYHFKNAINILCDYIKQRGSLYIIKNNEELEKYLCGKWDCGSYTNSLQESSFRSFEVIYNKDGSAKYSIQNSWRYDWEIDDYGYLHSFFGEKYVYILSDDVFFCDGSLPYVFVRQE